MSGDAILVTSATHQIGNRSSRHARVGIDLLPFARESFTTLEPSSFTVCAVRLVPSRRIGFIQRKSLTRHPNCMSGPLLQSCVVSCLSWGACESWGWYDHGSSVESYRGYVVLLFLEDLERGHRVNLLFNESSGTTSAARCSGVFRVPIPRLPAEGRFVCPGVSGCCSVHW